MQQPGQINQVTRINESIKAIVNTSNRVYMIALNAMLVARRVEGKAKGFSVISGELRALSQRLNAVMGSLQQSMYPLITCISAIVKHTSREHLLAKALAGSERGIPDESVVGKLRQELRNYWRSIARIINDAIKVCDVGRALAVLTKTEIAAVLRFEPTLAQVSMLVETTIEDIYDSLLNTRDQIYAGGSLSA